MAPPPLPIDEILPEIVEKLRAAGAVVVSAPPGAGKTTRVPPALLDAGIAGAKRLLMLEPRRVAARAAARRIASERGVRLGEEVGHHVRFDRCAGPRTRLLVVTEGILTRMLVDDPFLGDVGVVLFDEFHERSLDADLALALVERVRRDARPDLRVAVMSATLDVAAVSRFLGGAPVVACEGRLFPVEVEHAAVRRDEGLEEAVAASVRALLARPGGDVLVFLPGRGEIGRCGEALAPHVRELDAELVELHGDLPPERQDAALAPGGAHRRVVLATNVAETSITLPGVTAVVDSGLVRRLRLDPGSGLDRLELERVSRASAEQRRGRAGRVAPGLCIRLWSRLDHRGLDESEEPEIRRVELSGLALQLLAFGERDVAAVPFLEPPDAARLSRALDLLERLGATRRGRVTELGQAMAALPVAPRLARLLLDGQRLGVARRAAIAAALLSERDPFTRGPPGPGGRRGRRAAEHESESDVVDEVAALEEFAERGTTRSECGELHPARAGFVLRGAGQLERLLGAGRPAAALDGEAADAALRRALLGGFADRLVRRREPGSPRGVMAGGLGVRLADESAVRRAALFVAVEIGGGGIAGGAEALVRRASAVERDWLDDSALATEEVVLFDPRRETVVARRVTRFAGLVIDERPAATPDPDSAARALAAAAGEEVERALGLERDEVAAWIARARRLREWMPELGLPALDAAWWREGLPALCEGARGFADLRRLPLVQLARARLGAKLARAIDQHAPERLVVPSGSAIRLDYPAAGAPVLAVRLQELFGLAETPRIAGGRVPVVLHLLAPNLRPQQVTQDLRSFWDSVYPRIRSELRARYPRHAWPDDPWNAPPARGPRRRGRRD